MPDELARVKRAAASHRRALAAYQAAVHAAAAAGVSHAQIGRAAGITRQTVRRMVERAERGKEPAS